MEVVPVRLTARQRARNSDGTVSHTPADYINVLKSMNVEDIIRLNGYRCCVEFEEQSCADRRLT